MFSKIHQDAIELEVNVLESLVQRHKSHHGGTKTFKRLQMALKRARPCVGIFNIMADCNKQLADYESKQQRKQEIEKVFWQVKSSEDSTDVELKGIRERLTECTDLILHAIPNVVGRMHYVLKTVWPDIVRGFFLKINVLIISSISRFLELLERLAHVAVEQVQEWQVSWKRITKSVLIDSKKLVDDTSILLQSFSPALASADKAQHNDINNVLSELGVALPAKESVKNEKSYEILPVATTLDKKESFDRIAKAPNTLADEKNTDVGQKVSNDNAARAVGLSTILDEVQKDDEHISDISKGNLIQVAKYMAEKRKRKQEHETTEKKSVKKKKSKTKKSSKKPTGDFFDSLFG